MLPTDTVELVLLGIQGALRVNAQFRHAYADSTRAAAIVVPLPNFPAKRDLASAQDFYTFGPGQEFLAQDAVLKALIQKLGEQGQAALSDAERARIMDTYQVQDALVRANNGQFPAPGDPNPAALSGVDVAVLLTVRQWAASDEPKSMLRQVAGALINIAVETLANVPGLISTTTSQGKALRGFLQAIDSIDFVDASGQSIVEALFLGAVDTMRSHPEVLSADEKYQTLFRNVSSSIYDSSKKWFNQAGHNLLQEQGVLQWSQIVLSSTLSSAAQTVFADPGKYFGVGGADAAMVGAVGNALLDSILGADKIDLKRLFTKDSLERIAKAALKVVGDHPEILRIDQQALRKIIQDTAQGLAGEADLLGPSFLPETIRLVLESTGKNFDLLVAPGAAGSPSSLLVAAAKQVLSGLSKPPAPGDTWRPKFTAEDGLSAVRVVLDEVAQNPKWLTAAAGGANPLLGDVTTAVLGSLRNIAPDQRLSRQTAVTILEAALRAAGQRLELGNVSAGKVLAGTVVDMLLKAAFQSGSLAAEWRLARNDVLSAISQTVFQLLARAGVSANNLQILQTTLDNAVKRLKNGELWSLESFQADLAAGLGITA